MLCVPSTPLPSQLAAPDPESRASRARHRYWVLDTFREDLINDVCSYGHFDVSSDAFQEPPQVSHVLVLKLHCVLQHSLFICRGAGAKPGGGPLEPLQRGGEFQLLLLQSSSQRWVSISSHFACVSSTARVVVAGL